MSTRSTRILNENKNLEKKFLSLLYYSISGNSAILYSSCEINVLECAAGDKVLLSCWSVYESVSWTNIRNSIHVRHSLLLWHAAMLVVVSGHSPPSLPKQTKTWERECVCVHWRQKGSGGFVLLLSDETRADCAIIIELVTSSPSFSRFPIRIGSGRERESDHEKPLLFWPLDARCSMQASAAFPLGFSSNLFTSFSFSDIRISHHWLPVCQGYSSWII